MKLPELFHICADCPVDRIFYGDGVVIAGMYVVEIVFCYRKHVLQQEGCFLSVKFPYNDSQVFPVLLYLLIIDRLKSTYLAAERNHPEKPRLFIPQAVKCGTVCAALLIFHELVIFYFFKVFILDMANISFLVNHSLPPRSDKNNPTFR